MKWMPGDSPYWIYLADDPRHTVAKWTGARTTYMAWFRASPGSYPQMLSGHVEDVNVAKRAGEAHYAGLQRKAA